MQALDSNIVSVYGADWCGYTKKLQAQIQENQADLTAKGIQVNYVECTSEEGKDVCQAKGISGYPLIENSCGASNPGYVPHAKFVEFAMCQ